MEFYFFGDENAFHFDSNGKQTSDSYYARSLEIPPQTSVLGMLRYTLLEQSGLLKSDGCYTTDDLNKMKELIGDKGFDIENPVPLGKIKNVSPLFIIDEEGKKYIQTPFNHKTEIEEGGEKKENTIYTPFKMSEKEVETSHGELILPEDGEYDPKKPVDLSFVRLDDLRVIQDIIETDVRVGIKKYSKKDGFVRKCYHRLKEGYSFAVTVELEDGCEIENTVCYMGREKSSFYLEAEKSDEDFKPEIKTETPFFYAWSDLVLKDKIDFKGFAVTRVGSLRVLKSDYSGGKLSRTRHNKFYNVIKAGSVFYHEEDINAFYPDQYGCNKIIKFE